MNLDFTVTISRERILDEGQQDILTKYFKCNSFQVTINLLSEYLNVATAQLCDELQVCNL